MADSLKPTLASLYVAYTAEIKGRIDDVAMGFDPARASPTNMPTWTIRWNSALSKWQTLNASAAWQDLASSFAISISGNADTATSLATPRNINGVSFNGASDITLKASTPQVISFNNGGSGVASGSTFDGSVPMSVSYNTVGAPSAGGANASGTWGIHINGQSGTVTPRNVNGVSFNHSADIAVDPYVEQDETSNATRYLTFVQSVAGAYKRLYADTGISYNPNNTTLSVNVNGTASAVAWGGVSGKPTNLVLNDGGSYNIAVASATNATNATNAGAVPWGGVTGKPGNFVLNDGGTYSMNITGRGYPRRWDGSDINFIWSGQGGQPSWLWGGENGRDMYVYNPSNFNVSYASSANYANSAGTASYSNNSGACSGNAATASVSTSTHALTLNAAQQLAGNGIGAFFWGQYYVPPDNFEGYIYSNWSPADQGLPGTWVVSWTNSFGRGYIRYY
jgi:hypothetical protein